MKLRFAWIKNYKSINEEQKLVVNDKVTSIIGKNESGKSNIIDILGAVSLIYGIPENIFKKVNHSNESDSSAEITLEFELSKNEINLLCLNTENRICRFVFSLSNAPYKSKIEGALCDYFHLPLFEEYIAQFNDIFSENISKVTDANRKQRLENYKKYLNQLDTYILTQYKEYLKSFRNLIAPNLDAKIKQEYESIISKIEKHIDTLYSLFPVFHKVTDSDLKSTYTMNDAFFKNDYQDGIYNLIIASGCSQEVWMDATFKNSTNTNGFNAKRKIKRGIEKLEKGFNNFYNQEEHIRIQPEFNGQQFKLYVDSSDDINSINFAERSNGLKWYFNLYTDLVAQQHEDKQVIFLIDEPGTSLHVDAQKEVLALFDNLTKDKNQIIYTTHSPFMINEGRLDRIIPIQKIEDETRIFASIQSDDLEHKSRVETLTPLLEAIGMKMYQNIGMRENVIHIVTEGVSDAMYLNTMIEYFGIEGIKAIPSKGAGNVAYMTFILWGLGYSFTALFDYDKGGRDGANIVINAYTKGLERGEIELFSKKHIFYVTSAFDNYDNQKDYSIESVIDAQDYKILGENYSYANIGKNKNKKIMFATKFCDTINNNPEGISSITRDNFKQLIMKIKGSIADNTKFL